MTYNKEGFDITHGGLWENANIASDPYQTADRVIVDGEEEINSVEVQASDLTLGQASRPIPSSTPRPSEIEQVMADFRAAQASALFDPEAMALLESLEEKPLFDFNELTEIILTPLTWVKLAVLVRAYLAEPLDNGVRITQKGSQALKMMSKYLSILDDKGQISNLEEGL